MKTLSFLRKFLVIGFAMCIFFFGDVAKVNATTVLAVSDRDLITKSDRILHLRCLSKYCYVNEHKLLVTEYRFRVVENIKNTVVEHFVNLVIPGGQKNGRETIIAGISHFQAKDECILFLAKKDRPQQFDLAVGLDQGVYRVKTNKAKAGEEPSKTVSRQLSGLQIKDDADKTKNTPFEEGLSLQEFKNRVYNKIQEIQEKGEK